MSKGDKKNLHMEGSSSFLSRLNRIFFAIDPPFRVHLSIEHTLKGRARRGR